MWIFVCLSLFQKITSKCTQSSPMNYNSSTLVHKYIHHQLIHTQYLVVPVTFLQSGITPVSTWFHRYDTSRIIYTLISRLYDSCCNMINWQYYYLVILYLYYDLIHVVQVKWFTSSSTSTPIHVIQVKWFTSWWSIFSHFPPFGIKMRF